MVKEEGPSLNDSGKVQMIKAIFFQFHTGRRDEGINVILDSWEPGLGDPPTEYMTNDVEAGNFMIKD